MKLSIIHKRIIHLTFLGLISNMPLYASYTRLKIVQKRNNPLYDIITTIYSNQNIRMQRRTSINADLYVRENSVNFVKILPNTVKSLYIARHESENSTIFYSTLNNQKCKQIEQNDAQYTSYNLLFEMLNNRENNN